MTTPKSNKPETRGKPGRFILFAFLDKPEGLEYVGAFKNTHHFESFSGIVNSSVAMYLRGTINTLGGYVVVEYDCKSNPIDNIIRSEVLEVAKIRKQKSKLAKITAQEISKLTDEQILKIRSIINNNN